MCIRDSSVHAALVAVLSGGLLFGAVFMATDYVEYCHMGLEPVEVNQAYAARDVQTLGKLHVDYCFNCGSCTFVCPAKRPCTQMMGLAKAFYLGEIKKGGNK